jgi:hypothetical protein
MWKCETSWKAEALPGFKTDLRLFYGWLENSSDVSVLCLSLLPLNKWWQWFLVLTIYIYWLISIQPLGQFWQEPEPSQATGMALARCILGKFLGVVCQCFPLIYIYIYMERETERDFFSSWTLLQLIRKSFNGKWLQTVYGVIHDLWTLLQEMIS